MKIKILKKLHDKKKRSNDDDINDIKLKIAKTMLASHNKGDGNLCKPNQSKGEMQRYCDSNFDTDINLNKDCKDVEEFCYMCCENEYGSAY